MMPKLRNNKITECKSEPLSGSTLTIEKQEVAHTLPYMQHFDPQEPRGDSHDRQTEHNRTSLMGPHHTAL